MVEDDTPTVPTYTAPDDCEDEGFYEDRNEFAPNDFYWYHGS
jgi:hypothetical protein